MIDSLNRFAAEYVGPIAFVGLLMAVVSTIFAFYFYYNPRRPAYRIRYKVFSSDAFTWSWSPISGVSRELYWRGPPSYYIDVWNAGRESITKDVLREDIAIALQPGAASTGASIVTATIDAETHPGLSKFEINESEGRRILGWTHFDPGVCVRIAVKLNKPCGSNELAVYGQGIRLGLKRGLLVTEMKGPIAWVHQSVLGLGPVALALAAAGFLMQLALLLNGLEANALVLGAAVIAIAVPAVVIGFASASGLSWVFETVFNSKSPLEKIKGQPNLKRPPEFVPGEVVTYESRRAPFRFDAVGIPRGATLVSVFDPTITSNVVDHRRISFRGEIHSLSSAARLVAGEKGFDWKAIQGPAYWVYLGSTLADLRDAAEDESAEAG